MAQKYLDSTFKRFKYYNDTVWKYFTRIRDSKTSETQQCNFSMPNKKEPPRTQLNSFLCVIFYDFDFTGSVNITLTVKYICTYHYR